MAKWAEFIHFPHESKLFKMIRCFPSTGITCTMHIAHSEQRTHTFHSTWFTRIDKVNMVPFRIIVAPRHTISCVSFFVARRTVIAFLLLWRQPTLAFIPLFYGLSLEYFKVSNKQECIVNCLVGMAVDEVLSSFLAVFMCAFGCMLSKLYHRCHALHHIRTYQMTSAKSWNHTLHVWVTHKHAPDTRWKTKTTNKVSKLNVN